MHKENEGSIFDVLTALWQVHFSLEQQEHLLEEVRINWYRVQRHENGILVTISLRIPYLCPRYLRDGFRVAAYRDLKSGALYIEVPSEDALRIGVLHHLGPCMNIDSLNQWSQSIAHYGYTLLEKKAE